MNISKSSKLFLERIARKPTLRMPAARIAPLDSAVHTLPVEKPAISLVFTGNPPPDGPTTVEPWPYGEATE